MSRQSSNTSLRRTAASSSLVTDFERDGFVIVRGMYSPAQIREITRWTGELAAWPEACGKYMMYFEPKPSDPSQRLLNRIENFCPYHAGFDALVQGPGLLGRVSRLFGEPAVLFKDKINFKMAGSAGFKAIRASGLSLSAQFGVRDNNEASWTQIVNMLEFMSDATRIPILLDGDTGYGNFNNVRRLVHKLEQRNIAGVCIEDKLYPKTNSFIHGPQQPLADTQEFQGKIKAGKDCQEDDDFCIVARIEALRRAEAYHAAGRCRSPARSGLLHHRRRPRPVSAGCRITPDPLDLVGVDAGPAWTLDRHAVCARDRLHPDPGSAHGIKRTAGFRRSGSAGSPESSGQNGLPGQSHVYPGPLAGCR